MHLMKWSKVVKPKFASGLGISCHRFKNCALLVKWWWRFGDEKEALWRKVIVSKYGDDEWGWVPKMVPRYRVSGVWGVIASVGGVPNVRGEVLNRGIGFKDGEEEACQVLG